MDNNINKILSNPVVESIISLTKGVLASFPYTSVLSSLFGDWQNHVQFSAIQDTLEKHLKLLNELEQQTINKEFVQSEEYGQILLQTITKAKDEIREDKRTLFANFLTSCCVVKNADYDYKRMYLEIIDRLNPLDVLLLDCTENTYSNFATSFFVFSRLNKKNEIFLEEYEIIPHLDYLTSMGLLVKVDQSVYKQILEKVIGNDSIVASLTNILYYKTPLGENLINYLHISERDKSNR